MKVQPAAFPAAVGSLEPALSPGAGSRNTQRSTAGIEFGGIRQLFATLTA